MTKERLFKIKSNLIEKAPQLKETLDNDYEMLNHDENCVYNPVALESKEIDVISYGHQLNLEKADEFYAKEEPGQEYGDDDIMDFENMNF